MKSKWEFSVPKVVFFFSTGAVTGAAIALLVTNNMGALAGSLQILSMIGVSLVVLMSCRKRTENPLVQ